ncbi:hypothetical protein KDK95_17935 [Actinospica sp. MGRD01-02]|uniref:Uncharacterized protein n=1 Tax=Actinospica acidithermotolerans TaxID=2828514 RepID=A0A941EID9_9ACTN|nr:hypothetical protein [Actinospica acidithermotolerans]MBR7828199.1 hypothetical protein [Actinospica acidithermotolerans]
MVLLADAYYDAHDFLQQVTQTRAARCARTANGAPRYAARCRAVPT